MHDGGVEAVEGDAGVVDEEVDAIWMGLVKMIGESIDGGFVGYVEGVVFDRSQAPFGAQGFGLLQRRVGL